MSESGIRFIDPPEPNERLLAYELSGDFTGDDMRSFIERLEKIANSGQKALLFQDMVDRGSFDFETIKLKIQNLGSIWRSVEKIAVVGETKWLEVYIGLVDHLTPRQVKYFDSSEKHEAFAWLNRGVLSMLDGQGRSQTAPGSDFEAGGLASSLRI